MLVPIFHLGASSYAANSPDDLFKQANAYYENGEFQTARDTYRKIVEQGEFSPTLFYNLGNTNYRLKENGRALLNYRRALILNPSHAEAKLNEEFLKSSITSIPISQSMLDIVFGLLPTATLLPVAAIFFWITILLAGMAWFRSLNARILTGGIISLVIFLYSATACVLHIRDYDQQKLAMVVASGAKAKYAPAESSGTLLPVPEGTILKVLNRSGDWAYVVLPDKRRGWIQDESIASILPETT